MIQRSHIVDSARQYLGTPFLHEGRILGVGIDCIGLIDGVGCAVGLPRMRIPGYSKTPDPVVFQATMRNYFDEIPVLSALPGDILSFKFLFEQHLGIVTSADRSTMIHACAKFGKCLEHSLGRFWGARVVSAWRYRTEFAP